VTCILLREMNIIVTGSSGQIGAALCRRLSISGRDTVYGFDRKKGPTTSFQCDLSTGVSAKVTRADVIFHLAGCFEKNFENRGRATYSEYERDNIMATRWVLDLAERWKSRLVYPSTLLLSERPRPEDFYTTTKAAAEDLVRTRASVRSAILRLPRVLGFEFPPRHSGGSQEDRLRQLPPDIVSMFLVQAQMRGAIEFYSGRLPRWYVHVDEAVDCLQACAQEEGIFDARLHDAISIEQVARIVAKVAERSGKEIILRHIEREVTEKQIDPSPFSLRTRVQGRFPSSEALIEAVATDYFNFAFRRTQ
jgi:nucleoside-diphosphate-sugar epimerase